jgi:hypothetical protein
MFRTGRWLGPAVATLALAACVAQSLVACSGKGATSTNQSASEGGPIQGSDGASANLDASDDGTSNTSPSSDAGTPGDATGVKTGPMADGATTRTDGGFPAGWLYTSGAKIYLSDGSGGKPWMGRGVNTDDVFFCGYNNSLWMTSPDTTLETVVSGLVSGWKPTFIRMSLAMQSYGTTVSWLTNPAKYKTPMVNVINAIGANKGVYVLVTLRSDASMIGQDTVHGDPEATGLPSDSMTTPNATMFPTGTDAVYVALVDAFANANFVLFGLTNEPGGNQRSNAMIAAAMDHAVGTIRAEEDKLGVPHHIVSVQGNNWTSDISFYSTTPLKRDNVVYEVHGYPPPMASYTYPNIPVILGEYGSVSSSASTAFYADVEAKQIPNLAWDFDSYSNCAPDLVNVTHSATSLMPTAWGMIVQSYLLAH